MRLLFASFIIAVVLVVPAQATTLSFLVDPAQTGILYSGIYDGNAFPSGSLSFHSSALNGTVLNGQSLSLDGILANGVLARVFALDPSQVALTLEIYTNANGYPGFVGYTTGYLLNQNGAQIGSTHVAGRGMGDNGTTGMGLVFFTRADFGGAQVVHISGAHFDTSLPTTGYTITDVALGFSFYNNELELGTIEQLPEAPSLALLPVGFLAALMLRRKVAAGEV